MKFVIFSGKIWLSDCVTAAVAAQSFDNASVCEYHEGP